MTCAACKDQVSTSGQIEGIYSGQLELKVGSWQYAV